MLDVKAYLASRTNASLQDLQSRADRLRRKDDSIMVWDEFVASRPKLERLPWSWDQAFTSGTIGLLAGAAGGLGISLLSGSPLGAPGVLPVAGLVAGASIGTIGGGTGLFGASENDTRGQLVAAYDEYLKRRERRIDSTPLSAAGHQPVAVPPRTPSRVAEHLAQRSD